MWQVLRNSTNISWHGAFQSISNKPTNSTTDAHVFSSSPIFTQVVLVILIISILEKIRGRLRLHNLSTPQFSAHLEKMKAFFLLKIVTTFFFHFLFGLNYIDFFQFSFPIVIWRSKWGMDLVQMWICKSKMWSLICFHWLASYSNRFLMLQFPFFSQIILLFTSSFSLAFLFKISTKLSSSILMS